MPRRSAQQILTELAEMHDLINERTGKMNYSAFSRRTGIPHPTLIRIMQGTPDHRLNSDTAEKLIKAFQLSFAQVRGDVPIKRRSRGKFTPNENELEMLRKLRKLPRDAQQDVAKLIELRETIDKGKR